MSRARDGALLALPTEFGYLCSYEEARGTMRAGRGPDGRTGARTLGRLRVRRAALAMMAAAIHLVAGPALAGCTDPPEPGVNWQRCAFDDQNLVAVDLEGARLRDGSFFRSDLSKSNLKGASAFRIKLVSATLREAILDGAELSESDLTKADLTDASMVAVDLRRAKLFNAVLRDADLTAARLSGADLTGADLSGATWTDGRHVCAENSIGRCL
jgi:uncharacterized protein YjbI with pentapeptide repeats